MAGRGSKASGAQTAPPGKHKRECHKCRYNGKCNPICLSCPGPADNSFKGVNYVWLDDIPDPEGMVHLRIDRTPESMRGDMTEDGRCRASDDIPHVSKLDAKLEEELVPKVADFVALGLRLWVVLRSYWRGEDAEAGAEYLGLTADEYERRMVEIGARCPEVVRACKRVRAKHRANGPVLPPKPFGGRQKVFGWVL